MGRLRGKDIRHFSAVLLQRHARYLLFYSFEDQKCMNNKARNLRILQRYPTLPKKHVGKRHWNLRRRNRQQHRLEAGYPAKMIGFPWTKRNVARKVKLCYTLFKLGQTHQTPFWISPQNQETVQAELNLFAIQMLAQSPDFAIHIYLSDAFARLSTKVVRNFS